MIRFRITLLVVLFGFAPLGAASTPDQTDIFSWLKRMSEAVTTVNYDGTFVYQAGDEIRSMRIIHSSSNEDGEHERLVSLDGSAREVIRDSETVSCFMPDTGAVWVDRRPDQVQFNISFPMELDQLLPYYQFSWGAPDRVANRVARVIHIAPKDEYRYGYQLWLDVETALPLKSLIVDKDEMPVEQILFTRLELPESIDASLLRSSLDGKELSWKRSSDRQEQGPTVNIRNQPVWVPPGFKEKTRQNIPLRNDANMVEHMVYTDGLASFSIYIETGKDSHGLRGHANMGAVNAFGYLGINRHLTAVGKVPASTVIHIGQNTQSKQTNSYD